MIKIYYRSKKQKHDCVHVEVFLGGETGEATIGSRFFKGKVSIFPSYKFVSTSWSCEKVLFRSLDTWLSGECVSHCSEHPWIVPDYTLSKRSIFDTSPEDDVSAGGEDEDGENNEEEMSGNRKEVEDTEENAPAVPICMECKSTVDEISAGTDETTVVVVVPEIAAAEVDMNGNPDDEIDESAKIKPQLSVSGTKKVPRVRSGDSNSAKQPSIQSGNSVAEKKGNSAIPPHTYYVGKTNGWKLVKAALDKQNWQQLPFEYKFSTRYSLKWVERRSDIDYKAHTAGQLVCHIPNNDCITTKTGLLTSLRMLVIAKNNNVTASATFASPSKKSSVKLAAPARRSVSLGNYLI